MRSVVCSSLLAIALAPYANAETIFFVDTEGLEHCNNIGKIVVGFAGHKHAGLSADEMRDVMLSGDVDPEVANLMVQVIYSFDATEMETYRSVAGALCILDRLQPIEIER